MRTGKGRRATTGDRARILHCRGSKPSCSAYSPSPGRNVPSMTFKYCFDALIVQMPILFAEFVASAFLHSQQLISQVHEPNKFWVLVDWYCISHLDSCS
ncbi:hypothetical protein CMV_025345 [Castanea mollissima]|uniref:Uncharacterized protein n=1 Tax=Castanea mollissima TaxID=60419 RepID=A0A8J4V8Q3_9ROSI|nr:hypothetical protein CMV_025345 [Castanea mollissima]